MTAAAQDAAVHALEASAPPGYEIRSGLFRGFGTRHVVLVVVFCIAYNILGQLGWLDFNLPSFARRMREFLELPVHLAIGFAAILSAVAAENIFTHDRFRIARYAVAAVVATLIGTIVLLVRAKYFDNPGRSDSAAIRYLVDARLHLLTLEFLRPAYEFLRAAYISVLVVSLHAVFEARRRAGAELHAARIAALTAEHQLVEGELRAMQARVDPDLLFDSLRTVDAAYARDVASGQERLDALIRFLRAALPGETAASSTVARELELAQAYVALGADSPHSGPRFDVEPAALGEAMPSMLLLPLVRWALAGGSADRLLVRIIRCEGRAGNGSINREGLACLEIDVENRVSGGHAAQDQEVDNVRRRLELLYPDGAPLRIRREDDQRRAVLQLPLGRPGEAGASYT